MNGKQRENRQQKKTETPDSVILCKSLTICITSTRAQYNWLFRTAYFFYTRADFILKAILCDDDENTNISDIRKDWTSVSSQFAALPVMCLRSFSLFYKHCCAIEWTGC